MIDIFVGLPFTLEYLILGVGAVMGVRFGTTSSLRGSGDLGRG